MNATAVSVSVAQALAERLLELAGVVAVTDDETYTAARADGVSGSVGAHVRHTIDHVVALVDRRSGVAVDYDSRRRGTTIEVDRSAALDELERMARGLNGLSDADLLASIDLSSVVDVEGHRVAVRSTLGRELVFVMSHTIHHQAIIALLLASAGQTTPSRFGCAPSTPSPSCAPSA